MLKITQSQSLKGHIQVGGAKNAVLPIYAANILTNQSIQLDNLPDISDIHNMQKVIDQANESLKQDPSYYNLTSELCGKFRASILLIPAWLIKCSKVKFYGVGGCKIGKRPLDAFDHAFLKAGVKISEWMHKEYEVVSKPQKRIIMDELSVTATEAILTYLAFCDADYEIDLYECAIEPHVMNHIDFLRHIGADITVHFDHHFTIRPQTLSLSEEEGAGERGWLKTKGSFSIIWDSLEWLFYLIIWATSPNSEITVSGFDINELNAVWVEFDKIGIDYEILWPDSVRASSKNLDNYKAIKMQTMIYPSFCTDAQPMFGALLTQCHGISKIHEKMYEGRFGYLTELGNLGAKFEVLNPHQVVVIWPTHLKWGYLSSTDLRWGAAAIICGILAEGTTYVTSEEWILRWYENVIGKLQSVGVQIEKVDNE